MDPAGPPPAPAAWAQLLQRVGRAYADAEDRFSDISDDLARAGVDPSLLLGQTRQIDGLPPVEGHDPATYRSTVAARGPLRDFVYGALRPEGRVIHVHISGDPQFADGHFTGYRGVASDVTEVTVAGQQVLQLARFDSLTGLANRNMFQDKRTGRCSAAPPATAASRCCSSTWTASSSSTTPWATMPAMRC